MSKHSDNARLKTKQSWFSEIYVKSICTKILCEFNNQVGGELDKYGVDAILKPFKPHKNDKIPLGTDIHIQLKGVANKTTWEDINDTNKSFISFSECKISYFEHRLYMEQTPFYLVLFVLPKYEDNLEEDEITNNWLDITENELTLKKCAYFYKIEYNKKPTATKDGKCTIRIPKKNLLTPESLRKIIDEANNNLLS